MRVPRRSLAKGRVAVGFLEDARKKAQETEREIKRRMSALRHDARELEAAGYEVVRKGIRAGYDLAAKTPAEVRELGLAAIQGQLPRALGDMAVRKMTSPPPPKKPQSAKTPSGAVVKRASPSGPVAKPLNEQGRAALSGFVDEVTFGGADRALSAIDALAQGGLDGFGDRYRSELHSRFAEDAADQKDFTLARTVGQIGGAGVSVVALGGAGGAALKALANAPRLGRAARLATTVDKRFVNPGGLTTLFAAQGAGTGLGGQALVDVVRGEVSGVPRYMAAAAGGALEGVTSRYAGATAGGAVGGAATSAIGDGAEGRDLSLDRALDAAQMGGAIGGLVSTAGTLRIAGLANREKGLIGEEITRRRLKTDGIVPAEKPSYKLENGRQAKPDFALDPLHYLDAKLGPYARLTPNQELAQRQIEQLGGAYEADYWKFRDVGDYIASGAGTLGDFPAQHEGSRETRR